MNASPFIFIGALLSGVVLAGSGCNFGIGGGDGDGGSNSSGTGDGGSSGTGDGGSDSSGTGIGGSDSSGTCAGGSDSSGPGGAGGSDNTTTTTSGGGTGGMDGGVSPGKMGLTWRKYLHDPALGQDKVGCTGDCDPYVGDTACTESRPILCISKDGSGSNGFAPSFYDGWAAGNIGLTPPVAGTTLTSLAAANAQCVSTFGAGWEMAEHHDGGGGWAWRAYGNINDLYNISVVPNNADDRFWVHINDQPGNCWDP